MTNSESTLASHSQAPADTRSMRPASKRWRIVDVVAATLLTIGLVFVDAFSALLLMFGLGWASDCRVEPGCTSIDTLEKAWNISVALLLTSVVVGIGGLIFAVVKKRMLSLAPLAGYPILVAAWLVAIFMTT